MGECTRDIMAVASFIVCAQLLGDAADMVAASIVAEKPCRACANRKVPALRPRFCTVIMTTTRAKEG